MARPRPDREVTPDYLRINRDAWTRANARYTDAQAESSWAQSEVTWGVWKRREADLGVLPDVAGKDVVELGCGTAYLGAWLKRAGARRVVGIDITPAQLATATRLDRRFGLGIQLVLANAEATPLRGGSFDLAVSEYGASIWCDPYRWIPESARLLRAGGELVFLRNSTLSVLCTPASGRVGETLQRPQRGLERIDWADDDPGVEFHLPHGELVRLLRDAGLELLKLVEIFADETSTDHPEYSYVPAAWARRWPAEEVWRARKR